MADNMDQVKGRMKKKECKLDRHYYAFYSSSYCFNDNSLADPWFSRMVLEPH